MLETTVAVALFVLRSTPDHDTEVLLLKNAAGPLAGQWSPVAGDLAPGEREAEGALREILASTGLRPSRLYAAPFHWSNPQGALGPAGRVGLFVAWVAPGSDVTCDARYDAFAWWPLRDAAQHLPLASQQRAVERVRGEFVRRSPDEALRVL